MFAHASSSPPNRTDPAGQDDKEEAKAALKKEIVRIRDEHQENLESEIQAYETARDEHNDAIDGTVGTILIGAGLGALAGMATNADKGWWGALLGGLRGTALGAATGAGVAAGRVRVAKKRMESAKAFYENEFMEEHKKMVEAMDEAVDQYNDQNGTSTTITVTSQNIATGALVIGKAGKKG